ncbi:MAG: Formamidase [Fimbriimonadaceae bacterium]|nr:Formamidase [Fimbriimonadaceae bacterium]
MAPCENAERAARAIGEAAETGCELLIFPEAFLSGYCADSAEVAGELALGEEDLRTPTAIIQEAVDLHRCAAVVGYTAFEDTGIYNRAMIVIPGSQPGMYSKTHLPLLGFDRFATPGDTLPIFELPTRDGDTLRLGVIICFDLRFPEAARVLALKGADLIALPTNWPDGAQANRDLLARARAIENKVYLAACNRAGTENGFQFIGGSQIVDPAGEVLAYQADGEGMIYGNLDLAWPRNKQNVMIPGIYETNSFAARNPAVYRPLVD